MPQRPDFLHHQKSLSLILNLLQYRTSETVILLVKSSWINGCVSNDSAIQISKAEQTFHICDTAWEHVAQLFQSRLPQDFSQRCPNPNVKTISFRNFTCVFNCAHLLHAVKGNILNNYKVRLALVKNKVLVKKYS